MSYLLDGSTSGSSPFQPSAEDQANATQITFVQSSAGAGHPPNIAMHGAQGSGIVYEVPKELLITRWSPYLESEFQRLVALRADGKLSTGTRARLGRIRKLRQRLKNPIEASQLLRDFKSSELRKQALVAVQAYAFFVKNS